MKLLFKIGIALLFSVLIFVLHIFVSDVFPVPLNKINVLFLILFWFITLNEKMRLLWVAAPTMFLVEIFSAAPFGANSAAILLSLWAVSWFLENIFTNRSFFIVFISCFFGLGAFRALFFIFLRIGALFGQNDFLFNTSIVINILLEMLFTSSAAFLFYFLTSVFVRNISPKYIQNEKKIFI